MRLLVYGGTHYAERVRIGEWPPVPVAALQAFYGLNSDVPAFGAGILGESPFLIVREWQNRHERGGYAFSLLLDPGLEIWRRWGWNAAAMIAALFDGNPPLIDPLRREPEQLTENQVRDLLDRLTPQPTAAGPPRDDVLAIWLGGALGPTTCVLAPAGLGFTVRPTPVQLASLLQHLPAGLRLGQGWLVGGGGAHGRAYGARLVIDDEGEPASDADTARNAGRAVHRLFSALDTGEVVSQPLAALATELITNWGPPVSEAMSQLSLLAALLDDKEIPGQAATLLTGPRSGVGFEGAIREIAWHIVIAGTGTLSPPRTALAIRASVGHGAPIPSSLHSRLDIEAATEELLRLGIPPSELPDSLGLPPKTVCRLGLAFLDRQEGQWEIRLGEALTALGPHLDDTNVAELAVAALTRTIEQQEPLAGWLTRFADDRLIGSLITKRLSAEAQRRARTRPPWWPYDYIAFAGDFGGKKLCEILGPGVDLTALLRALHDPPAELKQATRRWINALAGSPLRSRLPVADKITLAALAPRSNEKTAWTPLHVLSRLWDGEFISPPPPRVADKKERRFLLKELGELAAAGPSETRAPNLQSIKALLGEIPAIVYERLNDFAPPLQNRDQAARYLGGLPPEISSRERQRQKREAAEQLAELLMETLRRGVRVEPARVIALTLKEQAPEVRAELLRLFVQPASGEAAKHHRETLVEILRAVREVPLLEEEVRRYLATLPAERAVEAARKYSGERQILEALLRDADPAASQRVVADLFEQGGEAFWILAVSLIGPYQHSSTTHTSPCPSLVKAITQYLIDTGGGLRDRIATSAWGVPGVHKFGELAQRILDATGKTR